MRRYTAVHDYLNCPMPVIGEPGARVSEVDATKGVRRRGGRGERRGGDEKKRCEVGGDANEPLEGGFTGGCGGMRSERLGTEEEKRCVVGELARPHVAHEISSDLMLSTAQAVPSAAKAYIGRHRAQFVGVSGSGGSEGLLTAVKTNLPMQRAIGKRIVILALTLLHFCVGAQALNLSIRGLPGVAGRRTHRQVSGADSLRHWAAPRRRRRRHPR